MKKKVCKHRTVIGTNDNGNEMKYKCFTCKKPIEEPKENK